MILTGKIGIIIGFIRILSKLFYDVQDFILQLSIFFPIFVKKLRCFRMSVSSKVRAPIVIRLPHAFIEHYLKYSDKDVRIYYNKSLSKCPRCLYYMMQMRMFKGIRRRERLHIRRDRVE